MSTALFAERIWRLLSSSNAAEKGIGGLRLRADFPPRSRHSAQDDKVSARFAKSQVDAVSA
jgi:hypothetical protein